MSKKITSEVSELITPFLSENGFRIYDIEFVKEGGSRVLRLYIDNPGERVSIDDCEIVSRRLSELLDEKDIIPDAYVLEVSSPGIERVLKYDWHFEEALGELVEAKLFKPIDGSKSVVGELVSADGDITIKVNGELKEISRDNISQIRIHFEF